MKYSACIELLFTEVPFIKRIAAAKKAGFTHIEFWDWRNKDLPAIKEECKKNGMKVGAFQGSIQGTMIDRKDHKKYCDGVRLSLEAAKDLGATGIFCLTDILGEDRCVVPPPHKIPEAQKEKAILSAINELAPEAKKAGVVLLMEPLNTLVDHAGYHINFSRIAWDLHKKIKHPSVKILYDIYHMQIMEGNLIETIRKNMNAIGYIHVADVPGRHEPGSGEINYRPIQAALTKSGYRGIVGFEFAPSGKSNESLQESKKIFGF